MENTFRIVTPVYNAEYWIGKCIQSVREQQYKNFTHIIVDDCSSDRTLEEIKKNTLGDNRFQVLSKKSRQGAMHSHIQGISVGCSDANAEDIIVHLDGDDWLAHDNVLGYLNEQYNNSECWVTYGNFERTDGEPSTCRMYDLSFGFRKEILRNWPFSHLRSFKKFLWDRINYSSFLDSNKSLLSCACDVAIMCPVLEMAHDKVKFIEDILYIYNRATPLNDDKVDLSDQVRCALEVLNMDRYSKL